MCVYQCVSGVRAVRVWTNSSNKRSCTTLQPTDVGNEPIRTGIEHRLWRNVLPSLNTYSRPPATKVTKNRNSVQKAKSSGFVLWKMNPNMWYIELSVGGCKVHAGCNGKLVSTPPRPLFVFSRFEEPVLQYRLLQHCSRVQQNPLLVVLEIWDAVSLLSERTTFLPQHRSNIQVMGTTLFP